MNYEDNDCMRRCSHGGVCTLERGHEGLHDADGYCQFSEAESVADEVGDAVFSGKFPEIYELGSLLGAWESSDPQS